MYRKDRCYEKLSRYQYHRMMGACEMDRDVRRYYHDTPHRMYGRPDWDCDM